MSHCVLLDSYTQYSVCVGVTTPSIPLLVRSQRGWTMLAVAAFPLDGCHSLVVHHIPERREGRIGVERERGEEKKRGRRTAEARKQNTCRRTAIHEQTTGNLLH